VGKSQKFSWVIDRTLARGKRPGFARLRQKNGQNLKRILKSSSDGYGDDLTSRDGFHLAALFS
jgi:hypothetical protein